MHLTLKAVDFWNSFDPYKDPLFYNYLLSPFSILRPEKEVPDILLYSVYSAEGFLPSFFGQFDQMNYKQEYSSSTKIFYSAEPNHVTHPMVVKSLDYGNYSISMLDLTHPNHLWLSNVQRTNFYGTDDPLTIPKQFIPVHLRKFATFIYSREVPYREYFCNRLSEYKKVDCPGKRLTNIHSPQLVPSERFGLDKSTSDSIISFASNYKFYLSFENSISPGYCSEKIWWAFWSGCIPIYCGMPRIKDIFNPSCFINVADFACIDDCIKHIIAVDNNDDLFLSYFAKPFLLRPDLFSESRVKKYFSRLIRKTLLRKVVRKVLNYN
jgi:hypothetical protein